MQPCATDSQPGREGGKLCPAPSAAARGGESSAKLEGEPQREGYSPSGGVMELACGFQANVYLLAVYCNRVGLTLKSNSGLCPERSRNGSSFLKSQRERRQRQRKKKKEEGVRGTHRNPVQGEKKIITSPPVTRETLEVVRSRSGPTKPEPINFKSWRIIQIKMYRSFILLCLREPQVVSL